MRVLRSVIAGMSAALAAFVVALWLYLWLQGHAAERELLANPPGQGLVTTYASVQDVSILPVLVLGVVVGTVVSVWMFRRESRRRIA